MTLTQIIETQEGELFTSVTSRYFCLKCDSSFVYLITLLNKHYLIKVDPHRTLVRHGARV